MKTKAQELVTEALALGSTTLIQFEEVAGHIDPKLSVVTQGFIAAYVLLPKFLEIILPKRTNDLTQFLKENKDLFKKEIVETEEFRAIYLEFLQQYFKENSEQKRKLLRNYLLSAGSKELPQEDYQSKIFWVLSQITTDELLVLSKISKVTTTYEQIRSKINEEYIEELKQLDNYGLIVIAENTTSNGKPVIIQRYLSRFGKAFLEYVSK